MVFSGRMPHALYWAYSSWVRYSTRVMAYLLLITAEYPWGMLGDSGPEAPSAFPPPPGRPPRHLACRFRTSRPPPRRRSTVEAAPSAETRERGGEGRGYDRRKLLVRHPAASVAPASTVRAAELVRTAASAGAPAVGHGPSTFAASYLVRTPHGTGWCCPRAQGSGSSSRSCGVRSCSSAKFRSSGGGRPRTRAPRSGNTTPWLTTSTTRSGDRTARSPTLSVVRRFNACVLRTLLRRGHWRSLTPTSRR